MKHYISLGAGVQSSVVALMAACGELTPMPSGAIFADTQAEPKSVYDWLAWLETQLPFPVYRATHGNLATDALVYRTSAKSGRTYTRSLIPVFVLKPDGNKGILPRKCTRDYKIDVIHRQVRALEGLRAVRPGTAPFATTWIGFSIDEEQRKRPSRVPWVEHRWPLLELGFSRDDCLEWMTEHGYPKPPRSACVFCPYHNDSEWQRLKNDEPEAFAAAVAWERDYQRIAREHDQVLEGTPFLHDGLKPLDETVFDTSRDRQLSLFDGFRHECEGACGV